MQPIELKVKTVSNNCIRNVCKDQSWIVRCLECKKKQNSGIGVKLIKYVKCPNGNEIKTISAKIIGN